MLLWHSAVLSLFDAWFRLDPSIASALGALGALLPPSVLGRSCPCPFHCSFLFLIPLIRAKHSVTSQFGTRLIWRVLTNVALGPFGAQMFSYPALRWSGVLMFQRPAARSPLALASTTLLYGGSSAAPALCRPVQPL